MARPRKEIESAMLPFLEKYRFDKDFINLVKKELLEKNNVPDGDSLSFFTKTEKTLRESDTRLLFLVMEILYRKSRNDSIDPDEFYTPDEQKYARQYDGKLFVEETISLPYTFKNVIYVNSNYLLKVSTQEIKAFMDSLKLNYNYETQREPTKVIRSGKVRKIPTVNQRNIDEMIEHLKNKTLKESMMIWNAAIGTAIDSDELTYNSDKMELTVHRGTVLDILDGYHRCKAVQVALSLDPSIEVDFPLLITNVMTSQAREHVRQIAQAMPMSESRKQSLDKDLKANIVIDELKLRSELKDRISTGRQVNNQRGELVSYRILSEFIEKEFKMKRKSDAVEVSDYLCNFFDYMLDKYYDIFFDKRHENNLMRANAMFAGYIILAKKMFDEKLDVDFMDKVFENINFNRDNPLWKEINVINAKGHIKTKASRDIEIYFRDINLSDYNLLEV